MRFFATLYYHLRYNHPLIYFGALLTALVIFTANIIGLTVSEGLLDAVGFTQLSHRLTAAKEGAFWSYRAWRHRDAHAEVTATRIYGYFDSTNRDGTLNLQVVADGRYSTQRVSLADLQVTNPHGLAAVVALHKQDPIDIDLYPVPGTDLPSAVIWLDAKPFNIDLIGASVARPDKNPPTDIVDRLFAAYNWKIALNR